MVTIIDKLQAIINRYSQDTEIQITPDTVFLTDLGFNSLELVEMVSDVEGEFGVTIPDRAMSGIKTVQDLIDFIKQDD